MNFFVVLSLAACLNAPSVSVADTTYLPAWIATPVWEVGDWDGPLSFTRITDLLLGSNGHTYLTQPETQEVWVIDSLGMLVNVIGRRGQGPGEFQRPRSLAWKGDTLVVWDVANFRVSLFSAEGRFYRSFLGGVMAESLALLGKDATVKTTAGPARDVASGRITHQALTMLNLETGHLDTLSVLPVDHSVRGTTIGELTNWGRQPFSDNPIWRVSPTGERLVLVDRQVSGLPESPFFTVTVFDARGTVIVAREIPFTPVPLDDETVDEAARKLAASAIAGIESGVLPLAREDVALRAYRESFFLPEIQPPVGAIAFGPSNELWLRRESSGNKPNVDWLLLSTEAIPVARISLPKEWELVAADSDYVVGAHRDEMDVFHLSRFRITRRDR